MPSTEGSAQPSTTLEVSSSHPRISSFGVLPFPAYHSCPSTAGLSRVRAPSSNREVGAGEPSSRRPAPSHQPSGFGSVRGLGFGVTPRALVSIDEFDGSKAFDLWYGRSHPSRTSVDIRRDGPSTTEPTTVRSAQSSRAMFLNERVPQTVWDSLSPRNPSVEGTHYLHGVSERFRTNEFVPVSGPEPRVRCRLRASAAVIRVDLTTLVGSPRAAA